VLASKIQINKDELLFLDHDYQHRKPGSEYEKINPHLSNDFNLFGQGSLFQYLSRCNTGVGQDMLAHRLCNPEKDTILIREKQSAINELCTKNEYVQDFQALSRLIFESKRELSILLAWVKEPDENFKKIRNVAILLGAINMIWLLLSAFSVLTWTSFSLPIVFSQFVIFLYRKKISKHTSMISNVVGVFKKYVRVLRLIEDEPFESEYLRCLQQRLIIKDDAKASVSLNSLFKTNNAFEIQTNALVSMLLNSLFLLDIHVCYNLLKWRKEHKNGVESWFSTIAEIEVLLSFATYAFNNTGYVTYPALSDEFFKIEAVELGHPLIRPSIRVNNDFSVVGVPSIQIITGANMAGKSTFLRTLAVNLLLGMNGAPVIAKEFSFSPCDILSSIKVQDSLTNNESYFYAELLRLKEIIEHVRNNPKTLVVLDEILRGTNTKDKQAGSLGILKKLMSLNAMVVIATHDLSIGEMENLYPGIAVNSCFEVELTGEQLFFDYKLKNGISKKLNASYLMHKMEIIDSV
jgi:DNA mismatch repair ATPase MutS